MRSRLPVLCIAAVALGAHAADDGESAGPGEDALPEIGGTLAAGVQSASGNTESQSVNLDAAAEVAYEIWRHKLQVTGYQSSEDGENTAERYKGSVQSDYRFSERSYLFANGSYESDKFGAFDRQASLSAGVGRRFVDTATLALDLEAGAGRRVNEPDGTNDREREGIVRLNGELAWEISETSRFTQTLEVISGDSNTATESVSAVRSRLVGDLSWRLSHTIIHNSEVPAGTEKTDTYTALAVEYAF